MRKWMIEFLRNFENLCFKIARVNLILITKSINLQLFSLILYGFVFRCDLRRFSLLNPFIEKSVVVPITMCLKNMKHNYNVFQKIFIRYKKLLQCDRKIVFKIKK